MIDWGIVHNKMLELGSFFRKILRKPLTLSHDAMLIEIETLILQDQLDNALEKLENLEGQPASLLFVTDLEAIHPYFRIGSIEQKLQGKFKMPTVILYPGIRTGRTTLKFLGIYPEDGSYRSIHIGG